MRWPRRRYQRAARRSAAFLGFGFDELAVGLIPVAERLERAPVDLGRSDAPDDRAVGRGDVADVRPEAVRGVERVGGAHVPVARHLRDDRGRGDGGALLVAVDDRAVLSCAERVSVQVFPPAVIDRDGLHRSNLRGLRQALWACQPADVCLVDGFRLGPTAPPHRAVVDGDTKSAAIAAASIVAKVTRDRYMKTADALYPAYGFVSHVGYITPGHSAVVRERGPSEIHRRSFQALCYRTDADVELVAAEA
jgi:ribonuclease HII